MGDAKTREDCSEERLGEDWSILTSSISRSGRGSHDIHVSNDDMVMLDETPNLQSDAESVLAPCSPRLCAGLAVHLGRCLRQDPTSGVLAVPLTAETLFDPQHLSMTLFIADSQDYPAGQQRTVRTSRPSRAQQAPEFRSKYRCEKSVGFPRCQCTKIVLN